MIMLIIIFFSWLLHSIGNIYSLPRESGREVLFELADKDGSRELTCKEFGHEMDLEMSPRPLGTTIFEEIYMHPGSEIVWKIGSNMGQKSIINNILNLFRAGSVRNGFVFKFPRKSWYREVEGSFLSPFHGHFCFSWIRTISLPGCTTTRTSASTSSSCSSSTTTATIKWPMIRFVVRVL